MKDDNNDRLFGQFVIALAVFISIALAGLVIGIIFS